MALYIKKIIGDLAIARGAEDHNERNAPKNDGPRVNDYITAARIRLVNAEGDMVGVVTRHEALQMALEAGLDLVEISPQADPPVCKILDYGKYKYELQKKKHEAKKNQKTTQLKEIQLRLMIAENDLNLKCNSVKRFLEDGDKVKIVLRLKGREMSQTERAMGLINRVKTECITGARAEAEPRMEGRQITMVLAPLAQKDKKQDKKDPTDTKELAE